VHIFFFHFLADHYKNFFTQFRHKVVIASKNVTITLPPWVYLHPFHSY